MSDKAPNVVNIADIPEQKSDYGAHYGSFDKPLTPALMPRKGRLGVVQTRVEPGKSACPFHTHHRADEVFLVVSGRGVFRYGETVQEIKAGDCISCPAASGIAHQLANPFDEDLIYFAIGVNDPNEICTYPDSGKIMSDALDKVGILQETDYWHGEPERPKIFDLSKQIGS
jgi:uncharacterized cupin superfamily protein